MSKADRSRVIRLAEAQAGIPGLAGERSVRVLQRGTLDVALRVTSYLWLRGLSITSRTLPRTSPCGACSTALMVARSQHSLTCARSRRACPA